MTIPPTGATGGADDQGETVAGVAQLYLGNILYALELASIALEEQDRREDAGFYRGIARKLAEARGRETGR
ncbi:MAG: hypothetical protein ACXWZS_02535 [Gemmatirosa sp.]